MGMSSCLGKCLLICINSIFMLLGLVFFALGIVLIVAKQYLQPYLDDFLKNAGDITGGTGYQADGSGVTIDAGQIIEYLRPVAICLIVIGVLVLVIAFLGCCGACCTSKVLLIGYCIMVGLIALIVAVLLGLLMTGKLKGTVEKQVKDALVKFKGFNNFEPETLIWNFVMIREECCGIDSYTDFKTYAKSWPDTQEITVQGTTQTVTMVTPLACCKMDGTFPSVQPKDDQCFITPTDLNNNWKTGCWDKVSTKLYEYKDYILWGGIGFIVLMLIFIIVAVVVIRSDESMVKPI